MIRRIAVVTTLLLSAAFAQDAVKNGNSSNVGLPDNGLFSGSNIDNVQVNNGNLHIQIPLVTYAGRGLSYSTFWSYDSRGWYSSRNDDDQAGTTSYPVKWEYGHTMIPQVVYSAAYTGTKQALVQNCGGTNQTTHNNYTLREPDGTKHHFIPDDYGIAGCGGGAWPKYADDGSGWMLPDSTHAISKSGVKILVGFGAIPNTPFQNARSTSISTTTDTNGNTLSSTLDSLGRSVLPVNQYYDSFGNPQTLTSSGTQSITVDSSFLCGPWTNTGSTYPTYCWGYSATYNVPTSINLPDGRSYSFTYTAYGEVASVTLPNGAVISYGYSHPNYGDGSPDTGGRRVTSRTVTVNGVSSTWTYTYNFSTYPGVDSTRVTDPEGNYTISYCNGAFNVNSEEKCQIAKVESYSANGQLLKVEDTEFYFEYSNGIQVPKAATTTSYSTVSGDTSVLKLRVETDYDYFASPWSGNITWKNPVEKREFVYDSSGNNPTLVRRTHTSYLHQSNSSYRGLNIADRVTDVSIFDGGTAGASVPFGTTYTGGNKVSEATTAYDSTTLTSMGSGIPGHDNGYVGTAVTLRGNPTGTSKWLNTTNSWISSSSIFDDLGHLRSTTDPGGHTTQFDYSDTGNWANTPMGCVPSSNSYAFLTKTTNAKGHRNQTTYFPCTALPASKRDENDLLASRAGTTFTYDSLNRPTHVGYPDGGHWDYSYANSPYRVTSIQGIEDATSTTLTRLFTFDGLGRVIKTEITTDPQGSTAVDTTYDSAGRVKTVSNPYRNGDTIYKTANEYDGLGRLTKTIPPDGTTYVNNVKTDFGSNYTIVTDQAGKKRKTYNDALGRLIRVDEPGPLTTAPTQATANISINGTEQTHMDSGAQAIGSVTLNGLGAGTRTKRICDPQCNNYSDNGGIWITVNGFTANSSYPSATTLVQQLVNALNVSASPVTASASGTTINMVAKSAGPNYSLSTGGSYNTDLFTTPLYTSSASGSTLTGGRYPAVTAYDNGNISLTIGGYAISTTYGQNSTGATLASYFYSQLNADNQSPVAASNLSGSGFTVTSKAFGAIANYAITSTATSTQGSFAGPSFTVGGNTQLSGGSDGTGGLAAPWTTLYSYDTLDNLTCVEQHGTDSGQTGCSSDPSNDGLSTWRIRRFTYNSLGQLLTAKNPESGTLSYAYDVDGNLVTKTDGRGITVNYSPSDSLIDSLHRVTKKTYTNADSSSAGPSVTYSYDEASSNGLPIDNGVGRRTSMTDASGQTAWSYDPMGRPWEEKRMIIGSSNVTNQLSSRYFLDGAAKTLTYPSGSVLTFVTSGAGHSLSAKDNGNSINYAQSALYTASGALSGLTVGSATGFAGYAVSNTYNSRLQPITLSVQAPVPTGTIFSRTYTSGPTLQNNGNISEITNGVDDTRSQAFTYDQLNRIATFQTPRSNRWGNTYTIDAWGNLTKSLQLGSKPEAQHLDQTANPSNQFVGFCYDAAGNMLNQASCGANQYAYDAENRITATGGVTYAYDGDGVRVKKSNGTLYWGHSFTAGPIAETDLTGALKAEYVFFNGKRIARRDFPGGAVHYYFSDHLGSASVIASSAGAVEEDADYFPYGGSTTGISANHFKFTGKERDSESGLDYFGARYYGNSLGRFLTPDWADKATAVPYAEFGDPQSLNLFTYVRNKPLTQPDLDGHCPPCVMPYPVTIGPPPPLQAPHISGKDLQDAADAIKNFGIGLKTLIWDDGKKLIENYKADGVFKKEDSTPPPPPPTGNKGDAAPADTPAPSVPNTATSPRSNPMQGDPGSTSTTTQPDGSPKQIRTYGPDGYPETDVDFGHDHGAGDPHAHDWERPEDGGPPTHEDRGEGRPIEADDDI